MVGSATLTRILAGLGRDQQDWSADYKLHARAEWEQQSLFDALLPAALAHCPGRFVPVALDDTRLRKTGKRIPTAFWQRDPLSPPFRMNLQWGLRCLSQSALALASQTQRQCPRYPGALRRRSESQEAESQSRCTGAGTVSRTTQAA